MEEGEIPAPDTWETFMYKTILLHLHFVEGEPFPGAVGLLLLLIILIITVLSILYCKIGNNVKENIPIQIRSRIKSAKEFVVPSEGPRFRKRDKIAFLGQRMVKRVKAAGSLIRGGQGRKRKMIAKFAKRLLGQQGWFVVCFFRKKISPLFDFTLYHFMSMFRLWDSWLGIDIFKNGHTIYKPFLQPDFP